MALIRQRKLTKQQIRRIDKQQLDSQDSIDDSLMDGVVMAHYGKQLIRSTSDQLARCHSSAAGGCD